jgi:hypothetical protein
LLYALDILSSSTTNIKDVDALNIGKSRNQRSSSSSSKSRTLIKCKDAVSILSLAELLDPTDDQPIETSFDKLDFHRGQIDPKNLHISETVLGEGQLGIVRLGYYRGLFVACKSKRQFTRSDVFSIQAKREMMFAAKLSVCRYINRYIGWVFCRRRNVEEKISSGNYMKDKQCLYIVQRYVSNGDARGYLEKRGKLHIYKRISKTNT